MDWAQTAVYKIRSKETGNWRSWDEAPMAAQVAKRFYEGVLQREAPAPNPKTIARFHNAVHWTYGPAWAGLYGVVEASISRRPIRHGLAFGAFMWVLGSGLAGPATKLAKPRSEYGATTNALDIGYHLAYGLAAAGTYSPLERI